VRPNYIGGVLGADITPDPVSGCIGTVIIGFTGATGRDIDIDIRTRTSGSMAVQRTILSLDDVTANGEYPVVLSGLTTSGGAATNAYKDMILFSDHVEMLAYDSNKTNVNASATIIFK